MQTTTTCSCICGLEIEWNPNLRLDVLSQVTWDTWHCPLTKGKYKTGDMIAGDIESKKVLKLSWCFCFKLVIASLHMFYSYCPDWWFHHVSLPLKSMLVIRDHHPNQMVRNELRLKPKTTLLIWAIPPLNPFEMINPDQKTNIIYGQCPCINDSPIKHGDFPYP